MAQPQTQQKTVWAIDTAHSLVEFSVKHMMVTTVKGRFQKVSGTVTVDEANIADSAIDVVIETASVDTRDERRDGHLRSPDFFDAEKFPQITFKSTHVERHGDDGLRITGDLAMHGVTHSVTLDTTINGRGKSPQGKEVAGLSATTKINRKDYGLVWNVGLETGGVLVSDDVKISLEIELIKQAS